MSDTECCHEELIMNIITYAFFTYFITIIISLLIMGIIVVINKMLSNTKEEQ
jgi:hypothetical protein